MRAGAKQEARRGVRRGVDLDCALLSELWDEPVPHRITDISEQGLWIATDFPLEVGTEVSVSIHPPDWARPLYVSGEVRRVDLRRRASDPRSAGMGIAFQTLRPDDRRRLSQALREAKPLQSGQVVARTLAGVPVGAIPVRERRVPQTRTLCGVAPAPITRSERQHRRTPQRSMTEPTRQERGFGGGLGLAAWLFGPRTRSHRP